MKSFDATFVDLKLVKTRSVWQFVFEVPTHMAMHAMSVTGLPNPGEDPWFRIEALKFKQREEEPAQETSQYLGDQTEASAADTRPPRSLPQRIGMLCNDIRFRSFISERAECSDGWTLSADATADWVRTTCGVKSRADILPGTKAEQAWNLIESAYRAENL